MSGSPVRNPSEIFTGAQPQLLQYFAILDAKIKGTGNQADESAGKIALLEGRVAVAESDINGAQNDIDGLQAADTAFDLRMDAAEAAVTGLDVRLDAVEPALATAQANISALQAMDVLLDQRLDAVEPAVTGLDVRLDAVEPALATAQADIDGLDVRVTALEAIGDPGGELGALTGRVGALESREDSDDISDIIVSDRVSTVEAALNELWGIVAALPPPGGSGTGSVNIASVSYADGGMPRLVGSLQLSAGDYAAAAASVGCGDNDGIATLELRRSDGTVVTTVGGVAGGVQWRTAAAGFTLAAAADLDLVLYSDSLAQRAFLRGFHVEIA